MAEEFNLSVENEVYDISFNEETSEIIVDIQDNVTAINVDFHQGYYPLPNKGSGSSDWNDITNKPSTFPPSAHTHPISEVANLQTTLDNKVDKVIGKQLSTEDYTTAEKNKLAGIQDGAEVNVNPDWNATSGDAEILNKPTEFPPSLHTHTIADVNNLETALNNKQDKLQNVTGNIGVGKTDASATEKLDVNGNVKANGFKTPNGASTQALTANGGVFDLTTKADLVGGKIPTSQLPAYVDDVLEFTNLASFPATGESGKIYIAIDTNLTYRWGGSSYVVMSSSLELGETSSTAYRGDRGKIAYDHSQVTGNPHNTTKSDIGLGNVPNIDTTNPANIIQSASYRFVTDADKTKLDGIAAGANNYTHPTGDGNSHIPATGTTNNGKVLKAGATANSASWSNVDWSEIANKPATFTATVHTHSISEVTNLQTSLDSKVNTSDVVTTATANKILKLDANAKLPANITGNADGNAATATKLQTARTINGVNFDGSANITINAVDSTARIASSEKGTANGVATLDSNGKVPSSQLPSYVDDVLEYSSLASFPATGENGKIYLALDTNKTYRWSGLAYVQIGGGLTYEEVMRIKIILNNI